MLSPALSSYSTLSIVSRNVPDSIARYSRDPVACGEKAPAERTRRASSRMNSASITRSRSTITTTLPGVPLPDFSDCSPALIGLDGAVDSPAEMRHHQPLHRPLHRQSHAAVEEGPCLVIQGSGFGEVAQYIDVDMLSTALGQEFSASAASLSAC